MGFQGLRWESVDGTGYVLGADTDVGESCGYPRDGRNKAWTCKLHLKTDI